MTNTPSQENKTITKPNHKTTTACLFNIVFYIERPGLISLYQNFLNILQKRFPCRSIFIIEDNSIESVKWMINGIEGAKATAPLDQITILSPKINNESVYFLILTYLLADIPTYSIWSQDIIEKNPILDKIEKITSKIVFDPQITTNLKDFAGVLLSKIEHSHTSITDFAWFSSFGWRELFASIFNTSEKIEHLFHAKIIRIRYNDFKADGKQFHIPAIYFQAWIAAQMNWKVKEVEYIEGNIRISYERFLNDTIILLSPQISDEEKAGQITSIDIEGIMGVHYLFKKGVKDSFVKIWISYNDLCEIPFQATLSEPSKEQLVLKELFSPGTNLHYHNMLKLLYQSKWNIK